MKITRVETIPFAIPYRKPLRFASGEVTQAEHVLVRVHTDDGLTGVAEAPPRPYTYGETQASILAVIRTVFAPQVTGLSPLEREQIRARLDRTVGNPTAKAAIDMAVWDVIGQSAGLPVTELLGGYGNQLRVAHMVGFAESAEMVAEAGRVGELYGITTFKVKVGRRPIDLDIAACRALREALGEGAELYIDGNRGWTAAEAARALRAMADLDLQFAEELCPADDVLSRRWLVSQATIPMFADESVPTPGDVTRELLGGSHRILAQCEGLGADVVLGNQIDGQLGSLCSLAFGAAFEATSRRAGELSNFLDMSDDLLAEPLQIQHGTLRVREAPGLGAVIDEDKLAHYRTD
jgi:L-alanine-DL-glutamate epimerase-like enolase superfamily enzyme